MTFLIILDSHWGVGNGNTSSCELLSPIYPSLWDHCFPLAQYTWITELFGEYRPSYSDILPLESVRGHSSGSSGATVKRSFSRFSGCRSLKAKAFNTVTSHRLFVWHWVLKWYFTLVYICLLLWPNMSPELNFPLRYTMFFKNFTLMWEEFFFLNPLENKNAL